MEAFKEVEKAIEQQATEPAARVTARAMFKYSEFLDVGEGAQECEHARDGQCTSNEHFHAWVRLPNPYQHEDIRRKGTAAKARKIRELRDPESDASVVIDHELSGIDDPAFVDVIIDEMLSREWAEDYLAAQAEVEDREEYEHITQDREEFNRLNAEQESQPEDEQSDEYKRLGAHFQAYIEAIRTRLKEIQEPKREELRARSVDSLVTLVRSRRVDEQGDRAFLDTYDAWMWFVGTFKVELHPTLGRPHLPMWEDIGRKDRPAAGTMFGEAPEVIEALKVAFNSLQIALQRGSAGN